MRGSDQLARFTGLPVQRQQELCTRFSWMDKRRLYWDRIVPHQYLEVAYTIDGVKLFSRASCDRTRG